MFVPVPFANERTLRSRQAAASLSALLVGECVLLAGLVVLLFSPRLGVFLLIAGVSARIGSHLVLGTLGYRETMRHPWPPVIPLGDDD
jgi:hypothetical protein